MGELPSGNVTFVYTDVVGSTRLHAKVGAVARDILDAQAAVIVDTVESAGGHLVDRVGDGLLLAFGDPAAGVGASLRAQLALLRYPWPEQTTVAVRMGIHSGEAEPADGNYSALAVSQGARIVDTAQGGQIVVSEATAELVGSLPDSATLAPLGYYRVRDFDRPIALFEVRHPELPAVGIAVRAPRLLDEIVPARRTAFVGREVELDELRAAIAADRLVTLAGPAGVGKTRLAVEVAAGAPAAWFVDLASAQDAAGVPAAIAAACGVGITPGTDPLDAVIDRFGRSAALLILDNCEHVLDAAALAVDRLLGGAPGIGILATSQAPLQVIGERVMRLGPLDLPPDDGNPTLESVLGSESARLFVERARAADTGFSVTADHARAIARVCRALDGLPLALELAATRVRTLGLDELVERLDDRFALLAGGTRGPARHSTLRAAIEWSTGLLDEAARRLLRSISVFRGSFTIADADAVVGAPVLEELVTLVDRGLTQREAGTAPARFRLLESIRAFAAGELREAGEEAAIRAAHLEWCCRLARAGGIAADYVGDVDAALALAAGEESSFDAAFELAEHIVPHPGAVPLDLLASRLNGLLKCDVDASSRVRLLQIAVEVALRIGSADGEHLGAELLEASRGADVAVAKALLLAGSVAASRGRFEEALRTLEEATAHPDVDEGTRLMIDLRAASVRLELGQYDVIESLLKVVAAMRARRDVSLPVALNNLAIAYERIGRMDESLAAHAEALEVRRAAGDTMGEVTTLVNLASALVRSGAFADARARLLEALDHPTVRHNMLRLAAICGTAGELLASEGDKPLLAARLLGAHQRIRERHGRIKDLEDDAQYRPYVAMLVTALGEGAYETAFGEGHTLDLEAALELVSAALEDPPSV